jgi:hypothetical protein
VPIAPKNKHIPPIAYINKRLDQSAADHGLRDIAPSSVPKLQGREHFVPDVVVRAERPEDVQESQAGLRVARSVRPIGRDMPGESCESYVAQYQLACTRRIHCIRWQATQRAAAQLPIGTAVRLIGALCRAAGPHQERRNGRQYTAPGHRRGLFCNVATAFKNESDVIG